VLRAHSSKEKLITNSDDTITCVSCLTPNRRFATFCEECGAPIGAASTIDPLQTIRAESFVIHKALEKRPSLIVLLGLWLTHFPVLVASIGVAIYMILYGSGITGFLFFWIMIALCLYAVVVLYRVSNAFAHSAALPATSSPLLEARFDVQVRQSLPFMDFSSAKWEMLVAVRNFFREAAVSDQSIYDELLVVRPPKRIVGGLTLKF